MFLPNKNVTYQNVTDGQSELTDVVLVVGGVRLRCHRNVLSTQSPYFQAMFSGNFIEKDEDVIEIKEVDPEAIQIVLSGVYSNDLRITDSNSLVLLQTASMLQFIDVEKQCIAFVKRNLCPNTCLRVLQITDRLSINSLFRHAQCIALWAFKSVKESYDFLNLPIEYLESYLSSDLLRVTDEIEVFEAGLSWVDNKEQDKGDRSEFLPRVMSCVRLSSLHPEDLRTFLKYPTIASNAVASNLLKCVIFLMERRNQEQLLSQADNYKDVPMGDRSVDSKGTGGENGQPVEDAIPFEDESMALSEKILALPRRTPPRVPCVVGHLAIPKVIPSGDARNKESAQRRANPSREDVECSNVDLKPYVMYLSEEIDKSGKKKTKLIPFLHLSNVYCKGNEGSGYKVVSLGKDLFISGGQTYIGRGWCFMTMHRYSTMGHLGEGEWFEEGTLKNPRRHHSVCSLNDDIYLIGGFGKHRVLLDSMERYNIPKGEWHVCQPIPEALYSAAACVFEDNIYVIGSQVYCYHTKSDSWTTIRDLTLPKNTGFSSAMVYKDWIYLTGIYTTKLMRFSPRHEIHHKKVINGEGISWTLEQMGNFHNKALNTCIIGSKIYSFSLPEDPQSVDCEEPPSKNAENALAVEVYDIDRAVFEVVWTGGPKGTKLENGFEIRDFMTQHCAGCFSMIAF